jgi:hypothetical protein
LGLAIMVVYLGCVVSCGVVVRCDLSVSTGQLVVDGIVSFWGSVDLLLSLVSLSRRCLVWCVQWLVGLLCWGWESYRCCCFSFAAVVFLARFIHGDVGGRWLLPFIGVFTLYMVFYRALCTMGCVGVSVSGGRAVRGSFTNHPCPGRAVGKTDLVVVAVQGAPVST